MSSSRFALDQTRALRLAECLNWGLDASGGLDGSWRFAGSRR